MKAILVLDEMPETCVECPCFERHEKDEWWCDAYGNYIGDEKPEWCPLKPMPERQKVKAGAGGYTRGFTAGFNKFRYLIGGADEEIEK